MYHQRPLNDDANDHQILQGYEQNSGLRVTSHSAYVATSTELDGAKIDGF